MRRLTLAHWLLSQALRPPNNSPPLYPFLKHNPHLVAKLGVVGFSCVARGKGLLEQGSSGFRSHSGIPKKEDHLVTHRYYFSKVVVHLCVCLLAEIDESDVFEEVFSAGKYSKVIRVFPWDCFEWC